ncbi:hypothetical protein [Trichloromonas sp.]|uniref:hypothetical protein n=1 Tax=Trichloromonas sp. TaxID=3069249 RepID=UPI003D8190E6
MNQYLLDGKLIRRLPPGVNQVVREQNGGEMPVEQQTQQPLVVAMQGFRSTHILLYQSQSHRIFNQICPLPLIAKPVHTPGSGEHLVLFSLKY